MSLTLERPAAEAPHIVDDISRREFVIGGTSLAALLAACSDDSGAEPSATISAGGDSLDFEYLDINTRVPRSPQRVVVMEGRGDLEFALMTGYPVIACGDTFPIGDGPGSQFSDHVDGQLDVLHMGGDGISPNFEELHALRPNLLVMRAHAYRVDWYGNERLSEIAPLLPIEVNRPTWREDMTAQLSLVGHSTAAESYLDQYDEAVASARDRLGDALATTRVAMIAGGGGGVLLWQNNFPMSVARHLGVDLPLFEPDEEALEISMENLDRLSDVDLIIRQVTDVETADLLDESPVWQTLPAVQAGHLHDIDPRYTNGLALTATNFVTELVTAIERAQA